MFIVMFPYCVALKAKTLHTTYSDALKPRLIADVLAYSESFCDCKGIRVRKVRGYIHEAEQYIGVGDVAHIEEI
jgi:hypothetical protein